MVEPMHLMMSRRSDVTVQRGTCSVSVAVHKLGYLYSVC